MVSNCIVPPPTFLPSLFDPLLRRTTLDDNRKEKRRLDLFLFPPFFASVFSYTAMSTQDSESSNRPTSPLEGDEKESNELQELKKEFTKLYDEWNTVNSRQKKQFILLSNAASQLDDNEHRAWEKYKIELIEKCNARAWTRLDDEGVGSSLDSSRKPGLRSPRSASLQGSDIEVPARKRGKYTWDPEK